MSEQLISDGNLTQQEKKHFIGKVIPEVMKNDVVEAHEFAKRGLSDFVMSDWGKKNEEHLALKGGVKALQQALIKAKFLKQGEDDGTFGIKTLAALINFQKSKGLETDGIAGPETQGSLGIKDVKNISERGLYEDQPNDETPDKGIDKTLTPKWRNILSAAKKEAQSCDFKQSCEQLGKKIPALLSDKKSLVTVYQGKVIGECRVIGGEKGFADISKVREDDRVTPTGLLHTFAPGAVRYGRGPEILKKGLQKQPYYPDHMPADNAQRRNLVWKGDRYVGEKFVEGKWKSGKQVTVIGISIQSPQSMYADKGNGKGIGLGGRYPHLVRPGRNKTWGCLGVRYEDRENFKKMASLVEKKGGVMYIA